METTDQKRGIFLSVVAFRILFLDKIRVTTHLQEISQLEHILEARRFDILPDESAKLNVSYIKTFLIIKVLLKKIGLT